MAGQQVNRISFDFAFTILTSEGVEIRFAQPFTLVNSSGTSCLIEPEHIDGGGARLFSLLRADIESASVDADKGSLMMHFASGGSLECQCHEYYEAWSVTTQAGEIWISQPGGGLAHWPPQDARN
ncbi:DUF6188 family protein [Paenarthrobacter sp. NPDC056912]|uniref:DUF6188 family protein n=1 Tax=Paenarthrobacter sp. NPDC056912 TaxID=3345965 RepID=UPI00366C73F0